MLKSLDIHLTNKCHFNCRHCLYNSGISNKDKGELNASDWIQIFTDLSRLTNGQGSINLLGGEPLMHQDFFKIATASVELGLKTNLISNFGFSDSIIKKISKIKFHRLSFGLHGCEKNHDWLRNSKGDYKNTLKIIKLFLEFKNRPLINITTVLHKNNLDDVISVLELGKSLNIDSQSFFFFTPVGRGMDFPTLMVDPDEWQKTKEKILDWLKKNKPRFSVKWERAYMPVSQIKQFYGGLCSGKNTSSLEVRSNGNVYYCGILSGVNGSAVGNLKKESLSDVYKSLASKRIKGVSGCTALAILSKNNNKKAVDPRPHNSEWTPSCPYELETLNPK